MEISGASLTNGGGALGGGGGRSGGADFARKLEGANGAAPLGGGAGFLAAVEGATGDLKDGSRRRLVRSGGAILSRLVLVGGTAARDRRGGASPDRTVGNGLAAEDGSLLFETEGNISL